MTQRARFRLRSGTAAEWTARNPVLAKGEPGVELDTDKLKVGDGTTRWSGLGYVGSAGAVAWGAITGTLSDQTDLQAALDSPVSVGATAPTGPATGQCWYDTNYLALRVYDGTEWRIAGDHVLIPVHNDTGSTINRTRAVYVSGSNGGGVATVALARADSASTMPAIGLADQDIAPGADGFVLASGMFEDVNTSSFTSGDALYVSPTTAGGFTRIRPTDPAHLVQKVALITHANTNGAGIVMGAGRANDVNNEITALTGVSLGDEDLGAFTGTTIPDNQTIKQALQVLETASEDTLLLDGTRAMSGSLNLGSNALTNATVSGSLLDIGSVPLNRVTGINDGTLLGNDAGVNGPPIALAAADARSVLGVVPITIGSTAPGSPANGDLWVDTNVNPAEMCTYDSTRGHWFGPPVYVSFGKANSTGAGVGHYLYSGVNGTTATTQERGWLAPWDGTVTGWAYHSQTTLSGWTLRLDKNDGSGTNTTGFVSRVVNTDRFNDMTVDGDFGSGNVIGAALVSGSNAINNSTLTIRLQRRAS